MNKKGFTLIELLAVIVVLAILVLLALPNVTKMVNNARISSFAVEVNEVVKVAKTAYHEKQANNVKMANPVCFTIDQLIAEDYLDKDVGSLRGAIVIDNKGNNSNAQADIYTYISAKNYYVSKQYGFNNGRIVNADVEKRKGSPLYNDCTTTCTASKSGEITITCGTTIITALDPSSEEEPVGDCDTELGNVWTYNEVGSTKTFTAPCTGVYELEVWGAQGGSVSDFSGGYGGYANGRIHLNKNEKIYVTVGGAGTGATRSGVALSGGYNGGGNVVANAGVTHINASGGGATHIAKSTGVLSSLENKKTDIIMVAGGGGGGRNQPERYTGALFGRGGAGGGFKSSGTYSNYNLGMSESLQQNLCISTQDAGGPFGQAPSATGNSAGGGGWRSGLGGDGASCAFIGSGSGGSGYINMSLLQSGYMWCYNCQQSVATATKTYSSACHNSAATTNCAKEENGYAKITLKSFRTSYPNNIGCQLEVGDSWDYPYTKNIHEFTAPCAGKYKLEVWGASGGTTSGYRGGYGGYATGKLTMAAGDTIYLVPGGAGVGATGQSQDLTGGYNGGGNVSRTGANHMNGSGGGASHVATATGLLSSFAENKSAIIMVAGGGGGGRNQSNHVNAARWGYGGNGGGYKSAGAYSNNDTTTMTQQTACISSQDEGGPFAQANTSSGNSAGGGGWRSGLGGDGGGCSAYLGAGSGGSGYINVTKLTDAHMTCYECEANQTPATKTITNTCASATPTTDCSKEGHGYIIVTYAGATPSLN